MPQLRSQADRLRKPVLGLRSGRARSALTRVIGSATPTVSRMPRISNLPWEGSSFFGRADELHALAEAVGAGERLVTLTGPAGMGKTRLALHHAALHMEAAAPEGGVWFCDLAGGRQLSDLVAAVVGAVGITLLPQPGPGEDAVTQTGRALAARGELLLVLDNFEQLVVEGADALVRWLDLTRDLRILVTSRVRLRRPGELCLELAPLAPPDALALLEARGRQARPGFTIAEAERPVADALVERLERNALAIELAAARLSLMTLADLRARVDETFDVLRAAPGVRERHTSLRAAIDASWVLLAGFERQALCQCTVFQGGFSLASAEAVLRLGPADGPDVSPAIPPIIDVIQALRDKSLLRGDDHGLAGVRLGMYESIREFVAEAWTDVADRARTERRHAEYYVGRGETCAAGLDGFDPRRAAEELALEEANLCEARRRHEEREPELATRVVLALAALLFRRGPLATLLRWLDAVLVERERISPTLGARVLLTRAEVLSLTGRRQDAESDALAALDLARQHGEPSLEAEAGTRLAYCALWQGRLDQGFERSQAALVCARHARDQRREAKALTYLAFSLQQHGTREALEAAESALRILRAIGARDLEADALTNLGALTGEAGQFERSTAHLESALAITRETGSRRRESHALVNLASLRLEMGALSEARTLFEAAIAIGRELGSLHTQCVSLYELGVAEQLSGRAQAAEAAFRHSASLGRELGGGRMESRALAHLGSVLASMGRVEEATEALRAAGILAAATGDEICVRIVTVLEGALEIAAGAAEAARLRLEVAGREGSQYLRFALRCLERALAPADAGAELARPAAEDVAASLEVGPHGSWFRTPGGERVDIARRHVLGRVLAALARRAAEAPGEPLAAAELLAAGWPDERVPLAVGLQRLYVTVGALRRLGLHEYLITLPEGYLLRR